MLSLFKYHGLGNDFVLLDRRKEGADIDADTARALCDRRRGLGGDGVLVLLPSSRAVAKMVIHNADGSLAEMCGNGLRCAVKHLVERGGLGQPQTLKVETGNGVLESAVTYRNGEASEIEVDMGPARLVAPHLPSAHTGQPFISQPIPGHAGLRGTAISMGNPHLVLMGISGQRAATLGPELENMPGFDQRTNVAFCEPITNGLSVTVWERGVGLTQACGTGACAAVAAAVQQGLLPSGQWIHVQLPGGRLQARVAEGLERVWLRGGATFVFEAASNDTALMRG
ncbi:MAG: diaminopimelate epimerase [Myxococcaceae bacterium]